MVERYHLALPARRSPPVWCLSWLGHGRRSAPAGRMAADQADHAAQRAGGGGVVGVAIVGLFSVAESLRRGWVSQLEPIHPAWIRRPGR